MKKLLLLIPIMLLSLKGVAQVIAYDMPNITVCNNELTDITVNIPYALGNQDPETFEVLFYWTQEDAEAAVNPIVNPEHFGFNIGNPTLVYVTVTNNETGEFAVNSFTIFSGWAYAEQFPLWESCGPVTLTTMQQGQFYTGPGGTGTLLPAGTVISESTTIYLYAQSGPCSDEAVWNISIGEFPVEYNVPTPLLGCDEDGNGVFEVNLWEKVTEMIGEQEMWVQFYETEEDASSNANAIVDPYNYTSPAVVPYTVYARLENYQGCSAIVPIVVQAGGCTGNTLAGTVLYDMDHDGCDSNDVPAQGLAVYYVNNNDVVTTFTNELGQYTFTNVPNGSSMVYVAWEVNYSSTPEYYPVTFPGSVNEMDFCINVPVPQLNVGTYLVPLSAAQPGFDAQYALVYYNEGTITANGAVNLQFDGAAMTFESASATMTQVGNTLTLNYTNLQPYAYEIVYLTFTMSPPPVINLGDVVTFTTTITPVQGDVILYNNTNVLNQFISNSFDPNDIAVREGETITPDQTDEYLYYTIRFQNIGNADAVNIKIENELDANLNAATLEPIASSHTYRAELAGNSLKFFFDDINLAGSQVDEPNSHGFITYRIKPAASVSLGDSMSNDAAIYFDFNEPIFTNQVTTTVQTTAAIAGFGANNFMLYPNPASGKVNIKLPAGISGADIIVTDVLGKKVLSDKTTGNESAINIAALRSGIYFVTVSSEGGTATNKLVVK